MTESTTPVKTTGEKIKDFAYYNWQVVLIIALGIGMVCMWQLNQSTKAEVLKLQNVLSVQKKVDEIDATLNDMHQREKELYPKLDKQIADLDKARKQIQAAEAQLKKPNKGDVTNEVSKLNANEVSQLFTDLGYPASVRACQ